MEENKNILTNEQLEEVVETIKDSTSEQVEKVREIHGQVEGIDNSNDNLEVEQVDAVVGDPSSYITQDKEGYVRSNIDFFDINKENIANLGIKEVEDHISDTAKQLFDLDDESVFNLLNIVREYKKNKNYPVWANMNTKLRGMIKIMALNANPGNAATANYPAIAKSLIQTFIDEAELDQSFIDLEYTLNEALHIPSIVDMYSEHTEEVMNTKIPEMVIELREAGEDAKADQLELVKRSFSDAYDLHLLEEAYDNSSRIRKALRKNHDDNYRYEEDLNYANRKTKFMMNDAHTLYDALDSVLDEEFTSRDIRKFIILVCMSLENLDREDLPQAAYIYYLIKNIAILRLTDEAKTNFSIELINNIKRIIYMIRDKEAKFNNEHATVQHKPKRSVRNRSSKK